MNVCLFTGTIDKKSGGPSRSVPILAKGLAEVGIDTTLMVIESDDMNIHAVDGSRVKLIVLQQNISRVDLEKIILDGEYDLIHNQGIWVPVYHKIACIARKHNIPYIMTPRGALEPWCYNNRNFIKRIKKKIAMSVYQRNDIQKASCILATADMEANNLRKLGFTNPITVIPNGIEIDEYVCRKKESFSTCKKQVLFLSRIVSKKGVDILIDSWVKVSKTYPDWSLIIVGNGDPAYINTLNRQINRNKLESCIKILPPVFGVRKYKLYSESSLFVLPTHSENFGMVIVEALSCGVPVITTHGTPWEILEHTKTGWWIKLSLENLEKALLSALSLPLNVLFEKGQRGSEMVRENFYYIEIAKKMADVYQWILTDGNKPSFIV